MYASQQSTYRCTTTIWIYIYRLVELKGMIITIEGLYDCVIVSIIPINIEIWQNPHEGIIRADCHGIKNTGESEDLEYRECVEDKSEDDEQLGNLYGTRRSLLADEILHLKSVHTAASKEWLYGEKNPSTGSASDE